MKITFAKRFAVRTALVTGTTLATIVGAQSLASLDKISFPESSQTVMIPANLITQATINGDPVFQLPADVVAVAPDIVILRHAGQATSAVVPVPPQVRVNPTNTQATIINPPSPVQVAAPQPIFQQSIPLFPTTRSSR